MMHGAYSAKLYIKFQSVPHREQSVPILTQYKENTKVHCVSRMESFSVKPGGTYMPIG